MKKNHSETGAVPLITIFLLVVSLVGITITYRAVKTPTKTTSKAATCAKIVNVSQSPDSLNGNQDFTCLAVLESQFANSRTIACGWSKNGGWPQTGGRWVGATCNGVNCSFGIRMDNAIDANATYELVAFDSSTGCGPSTGKRITLDLNRPAPQPTQQQQPNPPPPTNPTATSRPAPTGRCFYLTAEFSLTGEGNYDASVTFHTDDTETNYHDIQLQRDGVHVAGWNRWQRPLPFTYYPQWTGGRVSKGTTVTYSGIDDMCGQRGNKASITCTIDDNGRVTGAGCSITGNQEPVNPTPTTPEPTNTLIPTQPPSTSNCFSNLTVSKKNLSPKETFTCSYNSTNPTNNSCAILYPSPREDIVPDTPCIFVSQRNQTFTFSCTAPEKAGENYQVVGSSWTNKTCDDVRTTISVVSASPPSSCGNLNEDCCKNYTCKDDSLECRNPEGIDDSTNLKCLTKDKSVRISGKIQVIIPAYGTATEVFDKLRLDVIEQIPGREGVLVKQEDPEKISVVNNTITYAYTIPNLSLNRTYLVSPRIIKNNIPIISQYNITQENCPDNRNPNNNYCLIRTTTNDNVRDFTITIPADLNNFCPSVAIYVQDKNTNEYIKNANGTVTFISKTPPIKVDIVSATANFIIPFEKKADTKFKIEVDGYEAKEESFNLNRGCVFTSRLTPKKTTTSTTTSTTTYKVTRLIPFYQVADYVNRLFEPKKTSGTREIAVKMTISDNRKIKIPGKAYITIHKDASDTEGSLGLCEKEPADNELLCNFIIDFDQYPRPVAKGWYKIQKEIYQNEKCTLTGDDYDCVINPDKGVNLILNIESHGLRTISKNTVEVINQKIALFKTVIKEIPVIGPFIDDYILNAF